MMATDGFIRLGTAFTLVLAALSATADAPARSLWLGLADLRQPSAARVYPLDARPAATPARLHYLPLAPPTAARIACCLPLGMAVEADCPADMLAPPVAQATPVTR
jgi:hypothetical protein